MLVMAHSSENTGSERASERQIAAPTACESAGHQEVTQERQSASGVGERQKEQDRADTSQLVAQGQLPDFSISDSPASANANAAPDVKTKAADTPINPSNLSASEFKDMLRSGPQKDIDRICSTTPQSPAVSKQEIQNTCGIDLKSKLPEAQKGIVQVYGEGGRIGTGFLACENNKCQIVTDEHVVGDAKQVMLVKDGKATPGKVTGRDPENDLATISFDAKRLPQVQALPLGSAKGLAQGDAVFAVGHGKQLPELSVVPGQVTAPSTDVRTSDGGLYRDQFDTSMKAVSGHSGSPVFDKNGKVIGVVESSGRSGTSGSKVERVKELLRKGS